MTPEQIKELQNIFIRNIGGRVDFNFICNIIKNIESNLNIIIENLNYLRPLKKKKKILILSIELLMI